MPMAGLGKFTAAFLGRIFWGDFLAIFIVTCG
jgi:hypothetical protein